MLSQASVVSTATQWGVSSVAPLSLVQQLRTGAGKWNGGVQSQCVHTLSYGGTA